MHAPLPLLRLLSALTLATSSGCVAAQYQKASSRTPPPIPLDLPAAPSGPLRARLDTVIVHDGPGSWKRRAFWDEYVLSLENVGVTPARIVGAHLVSAHGEQLTPGKDWPALERESADWFKRHASVENVVLGAGTTVAAAGAGVSSQLNHFDSTTAASGHVART